MEAVELWSGKITRLQTDCYSVPIQLGKKGGVYLEIKYCIYFMICDITEMNDNNGIVILIFKKNCNMKLC